MRMLAFASRNRKELIRDPLSLVFGIGLPIFLLLIMTALQRNVSIAVFSLTNFTPGIAIFSFSFISLFTGMLIARDLSTSFLTRLFASPLTAADYIAGYSLPLLPIALVQSMLCFATAAALGLKLDGNIFWTLLTLVPAALLFIAFGLLLGTLFNDRSVGGITSILIQVVAFTSGMWFDLGMVGGAFKAVGYTLPFAHALDAAREALAGNLAPVGGHLLWVLAYTLLIFGLAILAFRKKMKE